MTNQFTIPSVQMVPAHFIPTSFLKAAADAHTAALPHAQYTALLQKINKGAIPSLRVNASSGVAMRVGQRKPGGVLFFDPKYAVPRLMTTAQIAAIKELIAIRAESGLKIVSVMSPEYARQVEVIQAAFRAKFPYRAPKRYVSKNSLVTDKTQETVDKVEMPVAQVNAPEELLAQLAGNSDATLNAIRENTAVMRELLAIWKPVDSNPSV